MIVSAVRISRTFLSLVPQQYLFSFPMSQALPWAFGSYENSVAMRVFPCRRSRFYIHETLSPFRCPVRFLQPIRYRSLVAESVHQCLPLWCFRAVQHCTLLRQHRSRYATTDGLFHRWKLGFRQFSFHHADRTRSASPYISSGLSAFSLCYFPLCLSTPGRVSVLEGHLLSTFCSFGSNLINAETAHLDVADIIQDQTRHLLKLGNLLRETQFPLGSKQALDKCCRRGPEHGMSLLDEFVAQGRRDVTFPDAWRPDGNDIVSMGDKRTAAQALNLQP